MFNFDFIIILFTNDKFFNYIIIFTFDFMRATDAHEVVNYQMLSLLPPP